MICSGISNMFELGRYNQTVKRAPKDHHFTTSSEVILTKQQEFINQSAT